MLMTRFRNLIRYILDWFSVNKKTIIAAAGTAIVLDIILGIIFGLAGGAIITALV